ncbi:MutS2 protein [Sporothrix brasiliensis 5110]|uniref:MutS2 protein n=1 Tax=Sporothrix brasiliensis 5110 TaxID=1398154 RepID=A0A0C2JAS0_9PEZI|nr:MutS2 protein [Sporothrix brasiliensis 5110]KIH93992.1 MutS2 protein [Sporothrix brasiliensis 5110]
MTTTTRSSCLQRRPLAWPAARFAASAVYRGSLSSDPRPECQTRGKKTRTVVRFEDLPQGIVLPAAPIGANERGTSASNVSNSNAGEDSQSSETPSAGPDTGGPAYPTVILQARRNMHKFANCVLLTRVGGFYELYFEHAQEYGPLLNIKVASKKTNAGPVPMLDRFLKVLVHDLNRYVAIAEEFPNSAADKVKSGGLMHDRRVARIVTPGTLIDENFMDPYTNNYVMAIHVDAVDSGTLTSAPLASASPSLSSVALGLAWLDLSTGHFYTQPTTLAALSAALSRVAPREIVLDERLQLLRRHGHSDSDSGSGSPVHPLFSIIDEDRTQQQQQLITYASAPPTAADETGSEASHDRSALLSDWKPVLESEIPAQTAKDLTGDEISAGSLLLHYVKDRLQGLSMKLQPPVRYEGMQVMTIDKNSMRSLEIKQTVRDGFFRGSLLHAIRRTVTKSGARLLNEWLSAPSTSLDVIVARQNLVSRFVQDEDLRDGITQLLRRSHDSHRLVQKFALGRGDPDDLLDLAKTITATDDIVGLLRHAQPIHKDAVDEETEESLEAIAGRIQLERPLAIARRIRDSVDEEGLIHQHEMDENEADAMMSLAEEVVQAEGSLQEDGSVLRRKGKDAKAAAAAAAASEAALSGTKATATTRRNKNASIRDYYGEDNEAWVMKPSASKSLKMLHAQLADLKRDRETLTDELRTRLEAPSLVLKWTPGLGHICHVRGRDAKRGRPKKEEDGPTTISSSRTTRSLHVPEWTSLGQKLDQVRFHIRAEEQRVFHALRAAVVRSLVPLRRNAAVLDELDIATSFARLALEQNLCRPRLHRGTSTAIVGGRHATVEGGLTEQGRTFTRNDLMLGDGAEGGASRIWLITGPNMAGKSTFLRQNALITILAQIGCYVPADYADLGLVDALFSRVGSADNLFRDQSTFMVEMLETAHILRQATPRSFVIMDEIGRGTTPEDGTAVAYAALHHLVHVNKCRGLFATHFHGLADLAAADGIAAAAADANAGTAMPRSFPVELYCTDVEEDGAGGFVYVHRLRKGINRQSHALKVARLAGLPDQAIQIAQRVLAKSAVPAQGTQCE